jgi:hypothetical protein
MNGLNYYDFHARWMDNAVPGFISPDPLAENHYYESPYAYCGGNPVSRTAPRGLDWYWNKSSDIPTWFEGNKKQNGFQHHKSSLSRRFGMTVVLFKEDGSQEALLPEFDVTPYYCQVNYSLFYGMNNDTQVVFKTEEKGESNEPSGQRGRNAADYFEIAGDVGGPFGVGAKNILDNRGAYMPRGQIYKINKEITVRTPIGGINTTSKVLNYVRVGGKIIVVAGVLATGYQVGNDISNGNYASAGARAAVFGVAAGAAFIPVVGWSVAAGIGVADFIWGDQLYNYLSTNKNP